MSLQQALAEFAESAKFKRQGPLSIALIVTRHAKSLGLPLDHEMLLAAKGTQVKGAGGEAVKKILAEHDIHRVLAREGGRTSRGSVENMKAYVDFLNKHATSDDLDAVEAFWIDRVKSFFASKPFTLNLDKMLSIRAVVKKVLVQAEAAQQAAGGAMIVGAFMQHMVGAKLELVVGAGEIKHFGSNDSDQGTGRDGDFDLDDVSIHVTATASEALISKCQANLDNGRKPLIVTIRKNLMAAEALSENANIGDRIEVLDFEQFISTNIHELAKFKASNRELTVAELVKKYNDLIDKHETDPGLRIEIAAKKP